MQPVASAAEQIRANRRPVTADNPFLQWEKNFSQWMELGLEAFREWRDMLTEQTFFMIYSQPWMQALLGLRGSDGPVRKQPGQDSDYASFVERSIAELKTRMDKGGPPAAAVRALVYVCLPENEADERGFEMLRRIRSEQGGEWTLAEFKQFVREQFLTLRVDEKRAIETLPALLEGHETDGPKLFDYVRRVATAGGPLGEEGQRRLSRIEQIFTGKPHA
jgi:hypothetical protein